MKLIVGLGNPGRQYQETRHNIGSLIVTALAKTHHVTLKSSLRFHAVVAKGTIADCPVLLAIPATYMNLSGMAVKALVSMHKIALQDMVIVCDDIDLPLGRLKIRPGGSSGGHKGLDSIIERIGTSDFTRLRAGVDRPQPRVQDVSDYVLSRFSAAESGAVNDVIEKACRCCEIWISQGVMQAMNMFNQRLKQKQESKRSSDEKV